MTTHSLGNHAQGDHAISNNVIGNTAVSLQLDTPELAATYDRVSDRQFEHGKQLIASLALKPGERVLDVGCGTGRLGVHVAELVGEQGEVVGIDPLPLRVELARQKQQANFTAQVGNAEDLSAFADATFDAVYLNSVFHWIGDKKRVLQEVYRVLKPNGRLALNSGDAENPHQSKLVVSQALADEQIDTQRVSTTGTSRPISQDALRHLLHEVGFSSANSIKRTFEDFTQDVEQFIHFSSSSSFGNFLHGLSSEENQRVRARLAARLEQLRTTQGIRLERYLVFATAHKG